MNQEKIETTNQKIENELAKRSDDPFADLSTGINLKKGWLWALAAGWPVALGLLLAMIF